MNLADANKMIEHYDYLVGSSYEGNEISKLVIIPMHDEHTSAIILRSINNRPYIDLLKGLSDFTIIAILNLTDQVALESVILKSLDEILKISLN